MKVQLFLVFALLWYLPVSALTQSTPGIIAQIDVKAEIATALYTATATQAAEKQAADTKMQAQRKEIENLRAKISSGEAQLVTELTSAQEQYVAALAARDRAYAQEIAVFRAAIEDIAATPEGAAALARFNVGDETGALAALDDLRAARDAARKKRADIESAAEGRRIATLALEARNKGKMTTAQVISRYEEVTRLDPSVHWDWIELGRLYTAAGKLPDALRAAKAAGDTATNDRDLSAALAAMGNAQIAQGNLTVALASYRVFHAIIGRLAQSDPGNAGWQRDLSISHIKIGEVQFAQGDLPAALTSYRASLVIDERLAQADPGNTGWQRGLSVSHQRMGNVQARQGDLPAALASYRASHTIFEQLAQSDPGNSEWQRDLSVSHEKMGDVQVVQRDLTAALTSYRASLAIRGRLAQSDPGNAGWQRDLSVSHKKMGDIQETQGDLTAALTSYQASYAVLERLVRTDPRNAEWQRDLIVSYVKLNDVTGDKAYIVQALNVALAMQKRGILAPSDAWIIDELQRRAGGL